MSWNLFENCEQNALFFARRVHPNVCHLLSPQKSGLLYINPFSGTNVFFNFLLAFQGDM